jgi:MOSC domain-containing protein YiiM
MNVVAVARDSGHRFSKPTVDAITLVAGSGVVGDAHAGTTVRHRSRVARDPSAPNLRQVHLIAAELLDELTAQGFHVGPGALGENVTTRGVDLLAVGEGTVLRLGEAARIEITGLRNPCVQLDRYEHGLQHAVLDRDDEGNLVRKAGVMAVVLTGGVVRPGDVIELIPSQAPFQPLHPV